METNIQNYPYTPESYAFLTITREGKTICAIEGDDCLITRESKVWSVLSGGNTRILVETPGEVEFPTKTCSFCPRARKIAT